MYNSSKHYVYAFRNTFTNQQVFRLITVIAVDSKNADITVRNGLFDFFNNDENQYSLLFSLANNLVLCRLGYFDFHQCEGSISFDFINDVEELFNLDEIYTEVMKHKQKEEKDESKKYFF